MVLILIGLFLSQSRGTARLAAFFGPIMLAYFATIAVLGLISVTTHPQVVAALSPHYALVMFAADPWRGFLAMGAAVLAVTGAEALYADMGHFGRLPIRLSWLAVVLPALVLNYLGQAALLVLKSVDGITAAGKLLTLVKKPVTTNVVDPYFIPYVLEHRIRAFILNGTDTTRICRWFEGERVCATGIGTTF